MEIPASTYNIRPTKRGDCEAIAGLIKELAVYEKMEDQAKLTGADLERDAFDASPPLFQSLVAEEIIHGDETQTVIVGYALYFNHYSTWEGKMIYLEDFYISPKFRHCGLGTKILKYLANICVEGGFVRLKFECLGWNEKSIDYYKRLKAINMTDAEGWNTFRWDKEGLKSLAKS